MKTPKGFKEAYAQVRRRRLAGAVAATRSSAARACRIVREPVPLRDAELGQPGLDDVPGPLARRLRGLHAHGTDEQKKTYLPKLTSGEWTGTMCLTEPHCGTDLGMLRTKAEPQADGSYKLTGNKIFISAGEHDMAENIVHLVLARLPDAPQGSKGISLFVVPKFNVKADGSLGERNAIYCGGLEHKMGIHGNATAQIVLDGAVGTLVGEPNKGLAGDVRDDERGAPGRRQASRSA